VESGQLATYSLAELAEQLFLSTSYAQMLSLSLAAEKESTDKQSLNKFNNPVEHFVV